MHKNLMHWDKLRIFYYVAKVKSFTKAGEVLNITQSAISRQIITLEQQLRHKLFTRSRELTLTRKGEILFQIVSKVFTDIDRAKVLINEEDSEPQSLLKVACTVGFSEFYLTPYLADFLKLYPKMQLAIQAHDITPDLSLRDSDVLIHPLLPQTPELIQEHLVQFSLKLYASPEYLKEYGTPKAPKDLNHHRLISYGDHRTHPFSPLNWHLTLGTTYGEMREPYVQVNLAPTRCVLAEAGLGILSIPQEHPGLKEMNLIEVLPSIKGPKIDTYFIYPKQLENSKRVQVFKEYIMKAFQRDFPKKDL